MEFVTRLDVPTLLDDGPLEPHADEVWSSETAPFVVTWHKEAKEASVRKVLPAIDRARRSDEVLDPLFDEVLR